MTVTISSEIRKAAPRLCLVGAFPPWKHTTVALLHREDYLQGSEIRAVISPRRLVSIIMISTSPEPMVTVTVTAQLGQMMTLSPRRLAEQPLRSGPGQACRASAHWYCDYTARLTATESVWSPARVLRGPGCSQLFTTESSLERFVFWLTSNVS
jgi:hypothetical protein